MTNRSDPFPAHIRRTGETEVRQPVSEHNRQASQYALNALAAARLGGAAKLVGLLHDMGKYTVRYRGYLENAVCGMGPAVRGSVNTALPPCGICWSITMAGPPPAAH